VTQSGATTSWYPCNGDINTTFYIWGAQLEAGSFPTSYIPTTTAAVTRAADVAGIYDDNFSSWYRQDEGSAFVDAIINGISSQNYLAAFDAGAGFANSHLLYLVNGTPRWQTFVSSAAQCQLIPSPSNPVTVGAPLRIAGGYAADSFAASRNGGAVSTDAAGTLPSVSRLLIGVSGGTLLPTNGHLRRLTYWPTRLPNETLQTITQ
jgi:hypothetical protein